MKAGEHFWATLTSLRHRYSKTELVEIIAIVKDCIAELREAGHVEVAGWDEHLLRRPPLNDGSHFEFHIFDDDVLAVYFKREHNRVIRMVGIYDHDTILG